MDYKIPTKEIQSLEHSALIELFVIDSTKLGGGVSYFHAGVNNEGQPIVWQGIKYEPLPIESDGFDVSSQGVLPTPKLRAANVQGLFSAMAAELSGLVGAKVIRKRTFGRYLDAVNFKSGFNPEADPTHHYPDQVWYIDRLLRENKYLVEWELASAFDLMGVQLPFGQIIKNTCRWRYRSAECGWTGGFFTKADTTTADPNLDQCGKRMNSCVCRFGQDAALPFGAYPGAQQL